MDKSMNQTTKNYLVWRTENLRQLEALARVSKYLGLGRSSKIGWTQNKKRVKFQNKRKYGSDSK